MKAAKPLASSVIQTVSAEEVYQVMTGAASQDPALFQASSARFKEMLDMYGIYDALHGIAAEKTVPLQIRQQSIIQFKNAALPHWRSRKVLSDEHRMRIRERCFTFLDEQDDTIAECNEVIVAKIARYDYPNNWPNLVDYLLSVIDSTLQKWFSGPVNEDSRDTLVLRRSIGLFNSVLKEFSNAKMPNIVKSMAAILPKCQVAFCVYYQKLVSLFLQSPYPATISPRAISDILLAHLVYKCIVKMAVWLWNRLGRGGKDGIDDEAGYQWVSALVEESGKWLEALVDHRRGIILAHKTGLAANPAAQRTVDLLTRHTRLLGKFFRRLQELSVNRFAALPCCPVLIAYYWGEVTKAAADPSQIADDPEALYPVRFLVQCMVLFKENLSQWKPILNNGVENQNVLPQHVVQRAAEIIITQFMPLNDNELQEWLSDPEQWVNEEETDNEQWIFEIRACSERVLMQLSNQFPDVIPPLLVNLYNSFGCQTATNLQEIIQKEALYCAIGRCSTRLKTLIPFEQWLATTLYQEAKTQNSDNQSYPIIKRRIAWLLGKWASESCISPTNNLVWEILILLLKDSDSVVRFTAAISLRECIDTIEFDINVFAPYLSAAVTELVLLLGQADTLEIKRRIDYTLNAVIEQSGELISDLTTIITGPLPGLWTGAGEDWLFKASLLVTVTKLVEATKQRSASLTGLVVPLVRECLSPGVATHLDEDAMDLWLAALRNATSLQTPNGPSLIDIFPQAILFLAGNLDLLGKVISILEAYFLLDGILILQTFAVDLFHAFRTTLSNSATVATNQKDMIISLNLLLQIAPSTLWGEAMHVSGLFSLLMKNILEGEAGPILLTEHIYLMSRIVMADRRMLLQLMAATATQDVPESKLYDGLLDQWWGTWDNMSESRHRKLAAMGIAALVSTARPDVLARLPGDIFNIWTDVLLELKEAKETAASADDDEPSPLNLQRYWELNEAPSTYYQNTEGTPEYDRRKMVYDRDPVRTVQLTEYIARHLNEAQELCGPQAFQDNYLSKADPAVLAMIQDQLSRG
ncbi:Importin N-terminal domain-containing protein [Mycena sanguinolenta]|uniref:Importin N-terminal domain-containing protein n=1 Tax=Mycena sanguinolenta TaxID=230812 RepID=A0A8H6Y705_9AGAR|nr:Importin N-terminal domain-containing protein [Mycena sanguinolenta]